MYSYICAVFKRFDSIRLKKDHKKERLKLNVVSLAAIFGLVTKWEEHCVTRLKNGCYGD